MPNVDGEGKKKEWWARNKWAFFKNEMGCEFNGRKMHENTKKNGGKMTSMNSKEDETMARDAGDKER